MKNASLMNIGLEDGAMEDVVICGGGLAGLTLALQIKKKMPDTGVTIVEPKIRPLPEACFKVGESVVEIATDYFSKHVGVLEFLDKQHLPKLGLRFFLGDGRKKITERNEIGISLFPPFLTYQVDRGRFENDLREEAVKRGVNLLEGYRVLSFDIGKDDVEHSVVIETPEGEMKTVACRWLVDGTGRKRMIQRKLKLAIDDNGHKASSVWFRVKGTLSLNDIAGNSQKKWKNRVLEDRWLSTNHLVGKGYWIWLIPVVSGYTSVGFVVDDKIHPNLKIGPRLESIMPFLEEHEPDLARAIQSKELCDIGAVRDFSYSSKQVFSSDRWSCIGEAAVFPDPFYSPGSDFIAFTNTITTEMICRDMCDNSFTPELVDTYNAFYLDGLFAATLPIMRGVYGVFSAPETFLAKHLWDAGNYWGIITQIFVQDAISHPEILPDILHILKRFAKLQTRMQRFFVDWAKMSKTQKVDGRFFDVSMVPFLQLMILELKVKKSPQELVETLDKNVSLYEEAAVALFFHALGEVMPERLKQFEVQWVNAWAISLDPKKWKEDGLFADVTEARDLTIMRQALYGEIIQPSKLSVRLTKKFQYYLMRINSGKLFYKVAGYVAKKIEMGEMKVTREKFVLDQASVTQQRQTMIEDETMSERRVAAE